MPASGSSSKSKTSGMRILWIPGGRKSHPKGRFDATNKRVTHTGGQKKSQVWSLGGNRAQADLLRAEPDTSLLDGPSVSRLAPATYLSAGSAAVAVASTSSAAAAAAAAAEQANENKSQLSESPTNIPCTPNSTTSTAPLISLPHSPQPDSSLDSADEMPTQTTTKPVIITTTTTAEIILDENRFSLLGKDLSNDEDNLLELPNVPKDLHNGGGEEHKQSKSETLTLNSSSGTNASTAETSPLTTSPKSDDGIYATPTRKKHYRHHNNHQQEDVNSIESITENNTPTKVKVPNEDLSFLDDVQANPTNANVTEKNPQRNGNVMINLNGSVKLTNDDDEPDQNTKRVKKKKNKLGKTKELDQLDGVVAIQKTATKTSNYNNNNNNSTEKKKKKEANEKEEPEDEKFVQCLYYTLMCCDCTIS